MTQFPYKWHRYVNELAVVTNETVTAYHLGQQDCYVCTPSEGCFANLLPRIILPSETVEAKPWFCPVGYKIEVDLPVYTMWQSDNPKTEEAYLFELGGIKNQELYYAHMLLTPGFQLSC